jgi:glycosyltransferase involved in cell wall biosynthesis
VAVKKDIFINARFLTQSITGVQRVSFEIVKSLDKLIESGIIDISHHSITLLTPKGVINKIHLKNLKIRCVGQLSGHLWEQIELPFYTRAGLLLSLGGTGPILKRNQLVFMHDASVAAAPGGFSRNFRLWYKFLMPILGVVAKKIFTNSEFSKNEIVKHFRIAEKKIRVVYLGCNHIETLSEDAEILRTNALVKNNYVLAVSSMNPNKNFSGLVKSLERLDCSNLDIVIAGGTNSKVFAESTPLSLNRLKLVGFVDDAALKTLYANAACFVYPSFYEGFGLPPLEAMQCGCPVIVSNAASLPEICDDAAVYCDPYNPQDIADKIMQVVNNPETRNKLISKGYDRVRLFSWDKCALEISSSIFSTI